MAIDPVILGEFIARLQQAATRKDRAGVVRYYAGLCDVSVAHLRRFASQAGLASGYKLRADRGAVRDAAMSAAADAVVTLIVKSQGDMPTWRAIQLAHEMGVIPDGMNLPVHYVDRYIRSRGIQRSVSKSPASTRKCKWGDPGDTLQVDSTNCQQWFFVEDDGAIRATESWEVNRNKANKGKPIIRYVAIDPPSGLFRVRYYLTAGESAEVTLAFLHWVFARDIEPELMPLAGVPRNLVIDKGPGNTSSAVKNLCREMEIDHRTHATGHSWAKGAVEREMYDFQRGFESELRIFPARSIEELNERARAHNIWFCGMRLHTRTEMTRSAHYAKFVGDITLPPPWELFVEAATTSRQKRTIAGGHIISYEGFDYYVGGLEGVGTGDTVEVAKAVLDWDEATRPVRVYHGEQCIVERALGKDGQGNYTDQRLYGQRSDAVLEARAEARQTRLDAPLPAEAPAVAMSSVPRVNAPTARLVIRPVAPVATYRNTVARLELSRRLGRELSSWESNGLAWGTTVSAEQIDRAVSELSQPSRRAASSGDQAQTA